MSLKNPLKKERERERKRKKNAPSSTLTAWRDSKTTTIKKNTIRRKGDVPPSPH
jgi:hypothetical protein